VWLVLLNSWVASLLFFIELPQPYTHLVWILRIVMLAGVGWHTFYIIRRDYLFNHNASITACLYNKGAWQLVLVNDDRINVTLHGETLVWYEFIVLGFILPNQKKRFIAIFPDSCDKDAQRKLRVELRLQARKKSNVTFAETVKSLIAGVKTKQ
jgi:hypothetical protein